MESVRRRCAASFLPIRRLLVGINMDSTNRTFVRRWLIPLALLTWGCGDPLAVAVDPATPALLAAVSKPPSGGSGGSGGSGNLVMCSKLPYDSVTQVIGPAGGAVGRGPPPFWGG